MGKISYANVTSTLALLIALGGTSYAAATITGKDVKDGSLTGKDIKNNSLTGKDIKNGSLRAADFKAGELPAGPPGIQGPPGPQGAPGATNTMIRPGPSVNVPANDFRYAYAECLAGEVVTGGGWFPSNFNTNVSMSWPDRLTRWGVGVRAPNVDVTVRAYAVCVSP